MYQQTQRPGNESVALSLLLLLFDPRTKSLFRPVRESVPLFAHHCGFSLPGSSWLRHRIRKNQMKKETPSDSLFKLGF
jgi:hypothetical protein